MMIHNSDTPSTAPILGFRLFADKITELISRQTGSRAFVYAIHGPWGSGKTTLLEQVRDRLGPAAMSAGGKSYLFVSLNAWKFQDRESLWRALLLRVIERVEGEIGKSETQRIRRSLYQAFEQEERGPLQMDYKKLIVEVVSAFLKLANLGLLGKAVKLLGRRRLWEKSEDDKEPFGREEVEGILGVFKQEVIQRQFDKIESIEQFLEEFESLVKMLEKKDKRLVVLIDDLDRCLPEATLQVFEAIKLFMDVQGTTFMIALDRDSIRRGLKARYAKLGGAEGFVDPDEYIEKCISAAFQIPPMSGSDVEDYLNALDKSDRWTEDCLEIVRTGLEANPRRLKRFVNGVEFLFEVLEGTQRKPVAGREREYMVKLYCLSYRWSGVFDQLARDSESFLSFLTLGASDTYQEFIEKLKAKWPGLAKSVDLELYQFVGARPSLLEIDKKDLECFLTLLVPARQEFGEREQE